MLLLTGGNIGVRLAWQKSKIGLESVVKSWIHSRQAGRRFWHERKTRHLFREKQFMASQNGLPDFESFKLEEQQAQYGYSFRVMSSSSSEKKIDWDSIREKLPTERTPEQKAKRLELFQQFDPNSNGFLSLAEVDKGCRDVLGLYEIFECKKVIMRAFQAAKGANDAKSKSESGKDYVEKCEFRLLLVYLRQYFEVWQLFEGMDSGNDHRINLEEFKEAIPKIEKWGFQVEDPEAEFAKIDANGGGELLFDEFADWAIKKGLDLEDDDE